MPEDRAGHPLCGQLDDVIQGFPILRSVMEKERHAQYDKVREALANLFAEMHRYNHIGAFRDARNNSAGIQRFDIHAITEAMSSAPLNRHATLSEMLNSANGPIEEAFNRCHLC